MTTFTIRQDLNIDKLDFADVYEAVYFLLQVDLKNKSKNSSKNKKQIFAKAMERYNKWEAIEWKSFLSNLISSKSNV